ncbi:MAG: IS3 family transposase [Isosphaeraceae bacterium]
MSAHQAQYPVRTMARVLKVSASGYYAWVKRPASARATRDGELTRQIRTIHAASYGTYGAPRVHAEFKEGGMAIGKKRIARLMRAAGLAGISRRRRPVTTRRNPAHHPAPGCGSTGPWSATGSIFRAGMQNSWELPGFRA